MVRSAADMVIGIDASNIRAGGGVTHLTELLRAADPKRHGFSRVVVWSGRGTLDRIEDRPWLVKCHDPLLDRSLLHRSLWQRFRLSDAARGSGCDVLFVPGGTYAGDFCPMVTFSQNLLPFEWRELGRFGFSLMTLKLALLRFTQTRTFRRSDGLIFLTRYARDVAMEVVKRTAGPTAVIPHGLDERFVLPPRDQLPISAYSLDRPFRILYVSIIDLYKHQWHVAEAVAQLREEGMPVALELIGPAYPPALRRLEQTLDRVDPQRKFVAYSGKVPYEELHTKYARADLSLFASSCETFGQILTEAMSAGLPIACSNRSAMPELLGDAGAYFDPEHPADIAAALRRLISSDRLRADLAQASFERVREYSWRRCADETFSFFQEVAQGFQASKFN